MENGERNKRRGVRKERKGRGGEGERKGRGGEGERGRGGERKLIKYWRKQQLMFWASHFFKCTLIAFLVSIQVY